MEAHSEDTPNERPRKLEFSVATKELLYMMQLSDYINFNMNEDWFDQQFDESFKNDIRPILHLSKSCHSSTIRAHSEMLRLKDYKVINHIGGFVDDDSYPILVKDGVTYKGIELEREILSHIGMSDLTDEKIKAMMVNEHRNCFHDGESERQKNRWKGFTKS